MRKVIPDLEAAILFSCRRVPQIYVDDFKKIQSAVMGKGNH